MQAQTCPSSAIAISGYASLFDVQDYGQDIVRPGAFTTTLKSRGVQNIRMLYQHDTSEPVGVWDRIAEDANGLFVEGRVLCGGSRGAAVSRLISAGAVNGLSIGFRTVRSSPISHGGRNLLEIDLWEVSIVTFPMLPQARLRVLGVYETASGSRVAA